MSSVSVGNKRVREAPTAVADGMKTLIPEYC